MVLRSGTYLGNATIRDITISDMGGTPDLVFIFNSDNGVYTLFATSAAPADHTFYISNDTSHLTGAITALAANKFTLGSGSAANGNGSNYYWLAIRDDGAGDFQVGTYTGTGSAQDVALNFNPNFIWVKSDATITNETVTYWKDENDAGNASHKEGFADVTDGITGYGSGGGNHFTVGTRDGVNKSGDTFYFFALKDAAGQFLQGSYTGNGSTQTISGFSGTLTDLFSKHVGSGYVNVQTRDNIGNNLTIIANSAYSGGITQLNSGDFHVDSDSRVNQNGEGYHWFGFIAPLPSGSPSASVSPSLSPSASTSPSPSQSPSSSASRSLSPSSSASASASKSASASASKSASASASKSLSPSASQSPSSSASASASRSSSASQSPSASPSSGFADYSRGNYAALPTDDATLENLYSGSDVTDVATDNDVRVGQVGTSEYMIHQFKNFVSNNISTVLLSNLQTNLDPALSPVVLQIYNRNTTNWETLVSNNTASPNVDFTISFTVNDVTDYIDGDQVISARIYQLAI